MLLLELLKEKQLPETARRDDCMLQVTMKASHDNIGFTFTIRRISDKRRLWELSLSESYLGQLVGEALALGFGALGVKLPNYPSLTVAGMQKMIDSTSVECYTYKDDIPKQSEQENNPPNRQVPEGRPPELQPAGVAAEPLEARLGWQGINREGFQRVEVAGEALRVGQEVWFDPLRNLIFGNQPARPAAPEAADLLQNWDGNAPGRPAAPAGAEEPRPGPARGRR